MCAYDRIVHAENPKLPKESPRANKYVLHNHRRSKQWSQYFDILSQNILKLKEWFTIALHKSNEARRRSVCWKPQNTDEKPKYMKCWV